jgi:hypothetical protein
MNTFIEDKKENFQFFFFHKSFRKNVTICHIAATPLTHTQSIQIPQTPNNFLRALV